MKKILIILFLTFTLIFSNGNVLALNETERGYISQNCSSIRQSLKLLQVADSKTRVYLGSVYNTVLANFLSPLKKRVENNGLALDNGWAKISVQESDFSVLRSDFSATYISYQRALEELADYDCLADPDGFYEKLESVREERAEVAAVVSQLRTRLDTHLATAKTLLSNLEAKNE